MSNASSGIKLLKIQSCVFEDIQENANETRRDGFFGINYPAIGSKVEVYNNVFYFKTAGAYLTSGIFTSQGATDPDCGENEQYNLLIKIELLSHQP